VEQFLKKKRKSEAKSPIMQPEQRQAKIVYSGHLFLEVFSIKVSVS
jgi:hypothetical protein